MITVGRSADFKSNLSFMRFSTIFMSFCLIILIVLSILVVFQLICMVDVQNTISEKNSTESLNESQLKKIWKLRSLKPTFSIRIFGSVFYLWRNLPYIPLYFRLFQNFLTTQRGVYNFVDPRFISVRWKGYFALDNKRILPNLFDKEGFSKSYYISYKWTDYCWLSFFTYSSQRPSICSVV